ncbi:MAG TPA: DUF5666 domain-containing protein [Thermoanaerobaculia bacterium]|jgi:hypothetical protein|nr:DUF5666 domain-containing protein [Thermoanaerobaculia bacterium]
MIHRTFAPLATLALLALALVSTGCSHGSSPTEPAEPAVSNLASSTAASSSIGTKRHGADDPAGDDHGGQAGRGADDPAGDDHGGQAGRGADDPAGGRHGGQQRPARGTEFSGVVSSVTGQTLTLASGVHVVVNGQTQWNARGDLKSLDRVAAAVAAGRRTRVEGRGARQADGSLLAQTIKAETGR